MCPHQFTGLVISNSLRRSTMDDICPAQFGGYGCKNHSCKFAHSFQNLCNPKNWVFFDAPSIHMLNFLAYKYQGHHYFKSYLLRGRGPIIRCATPEDALCVLQEYKVPTLPQPHRSFSPCCILCLWTIRVSDPKMFLCDIGGWWQGIPN